MKEKGVTLLLIKEGNEMKEKGVTLLLIKEGNKRERSWFVTY